MPLCFGKTKKQSNKELEETFSKFDKDNRGFLLPDDAHKAIQDIMGSRLASNARLQRITPARFKNTKQYQLEMFYDLFEEIDLYIEDLEKVFTDHDADHDKKLSAIEARAAINKVYSGKPKKRADLLNSDSEFLKRAEVKVPCDPALNGFYGLEQFCDLFDAVEDEIDAATAPVVEASAPAPLESADAGQAKAQEAEKPQAQEPEKPQAPKTEVVKESNVDSLMSKAGAGTELTEGGAPHHSGDSVLSSETHDSDLSDSPSPTAKAKAMAQTHSHKAPDSSIEPLPPPPEHPSTTQTLALQAAHGSVSLSEQMYACGDTAKRKELLIDILTSEEKEAELLKHQLKQAECVHGENPDDLRNLVLDMRRELAPMEENNLQLLQKKQTADVLMRRAEELEKERISLLSQLKREAVSAGFGTPRMQQQGAEDDFLLHLFNTEAQRGGSDTLDNYGCLRVLKEINEELASVSLLEAARTAAGIHRGPVTLEDFLKIFHEVDRLAEAAEE